MPQHIGYVSLLVRDYDEAIAYFTGKLGFELVEDTDLGNGKRWVLIAPPGSLETRVLLAKAVTEDQARHIGDQAGGRVFLFLQTDGFWRDYPLSRKRHSVSRGTAGGAIRNCCGV
jgi:catechol 2,3-dioxygenase-like lactoylglutathione lyase family enzyme